MTKRLQFWLLAGAAALLLLGPIRLGDLAGYDDAVYAHISKHIVESGKWMLLESNGYPMLEHPPGFVWMQAALFSLFGYSDFIAKLPSAASGVGVVLLVWWLTRRLYEGHAEIPLLAMFIMLATPYFIKYTSHGMTDVPFTLLFTAAVCAWVAAERHPAWYVAVAILCGYAMLTRGVVGLAVPLTLALHWIIEGRMTRMTVRRSKPAAAGAVDRSSRSWALVALAAAFIPAAGWYGYQVSMYGNFFWQVQGSFLSDKIAGDVAGSWRAYTGAPEYLWMLAQSYWPWLPFLILGLAAAVRELRAARAAATDQGKTNLHGKLHDDAREQAEAARLAKVPVARRSLLLIWIAVMFVACAIGGSRVLRYLLPAYPAFSILAAVGLTKLVGERRVALGLKWAAPVGLAIAAGIAAFPPVSLHAAEIKPIAEAVRSVTEENERFGFYDAGQPRFDESGQLQWYGGRTMWILTEREQFDNALAEPWAKTWVVDQATFDEKFADRDDIEVVARSGHLVCVRLQG